MLGGFGARMLWLHACWLLPSISAGRNSAKRTTPHPALDIEVIKSLLGEMLKVVFSTRL
jgi:hypothetical protein